jgi:hypothetical protein
MAVQEVARVIPLARAPLQVGLVFRDKGMPEAQPKIMLAVQTAAVAAAQVA